MDNILLHFEYNVLPILSFCVMSLHKQSIHFVIGICTPFPIGPLYSQQSVRKYYFLFSEMFIFGDLGYVDFITATLAFSKVL